MQFVDERKDIYPHNREPCHVPAKSSEFSLAAYRKTRRKGRTAGGPFRLSKTKPTSLIDYLSQSPERFAVREAFTTRGVLQGLPGVNLVVMDEVIELPDTSREVLGRSLELSRIPTTNPEAFLTEPEEWLGRARLAGTRQVTYLPARQVNLVNWSGGVGKTTLAMAICKRFVQRTGLPAALLELSMGGSALHARVSADLPEFFAIATNKAEPGHVAGSKSVPNGWADDRCVVERRSGGRAARCWRIFEKSTPCLWWIASLAIRFLRNCPGLCR